MYVFGFLKYTECTICTAFQQFPPASIPFQLYPLHTNPVQFTPQTNWARRTFKSGRIASQSKVVAN